MHPTLNIAVKAARRAGGIINRASRDVEQIKVSAKRDKDFVTEVDKAAEAAIIEVLKEAYPDHAILAEESGASGDSDFVWIIDPLDGTTNFIHGFPQYCISIAQTQKGVLQHAVIYDPNRNELFTASKGAGAYLNERRIRVSKRAKMNEALIGTGFPFRYFEHVDAYLGIFRDLSPWDMAAGALLITEAGGLVGDLAGEQNYLETGNIVGGNPKVFAQLLQIIAPHLNANLKA
ncbi:MAG: inositol monophosphatase [Rhodocyclaceae bacterium]|nr:inositol monophosphatase [Rhodocyclaceae bacterium]